MRYYPRHFPRRTEKGHEKCLCMCMHQILHPVRILFQEEEQHESNVHLHLDAADLGDFPASYLIPALKPHEFPAVGVYVDPRIVPGFRYRVRPIDDEVKLTNINCKDCQNVQQAIPCWLQSRLA
jgi:hypothetical protein